MPEHRRFTTDEIEAGIAGAIAAGDFEVVPGLIQLLAVRNPERAQTVLDTIELGIEISKRSALDEEAPSCG